MSLKHSMQSQLKQPAGLTSKEYSTDLALHACNILRLTMDT